jgi:hypothetical protein
MSMDLSELQLQIENQRRVLQELEQELERHAGKPNRSWYRSGFYTSYYIMSGLFLGALASWVSLAFNIVGAWVAYGDPLRLLRVYATFFGGEAVLTQPGAGVATLLALILHSATGAVVGAPIHVVYSRYVVRSTLGRRLVVGALLGVVMWVVNFYMLLSWMQPLVSGGTWIVDNIPWWVALLTHVSFTLTMLVFQPFWSFDPGRVQDRQEYHHTVSATDSRAA